MKQIQTPPTNSSTPNSSTTGAPTTKTSTTRTSTTRKRPTIGSKTSSGIQPSVRPHIQPQHIAQPDTAQPDTAQPDTMQSDTAQPDTMQSDTMQSDTMQSDTMQSDTMQSDTVESDIMQPDTAQPDIPGARQSAHYVATLERVPQKAASPDKILPDESFDLLRVLPWVDPVMDSSGHDPRSSYVELFWLPAVGPSCIWLLRRLAIWLDTYPKGFEIQTKLIAKELGLGSSSQKGPPLKRTIKRCCDFGLAHLGDNSCMFVRQYLPQITPRLISRLSNRLQLAHQKFISSGNDAALLDSYVSSKSE